MTTYDAYTAREADRLAKFARWLSDHGHAGKGMIGEFGWPNFPGAVKESSGGAYQQSSLDAWNKLGGYYLYAAQKNNVELTYWATGEYWGTSYGKLAFKGNPIGSALPAGQVLIDSPVATKHKGINLSQHEFQKSMGWPKAASVQYLASKGIKFYRVPLGWEDMQPSFGAELVSGQVSSLKSFLDACQSSGCQVILDCHNYGVHNGSRCDGNTLGNFWVKMTAAVGSHPAVLGFDIMNEPNSEDMGWNESQGFQEWAKIAQAVVTACRNAGFQKRMYIETYQWSGIDRFAQNFPNGPWVQDPANNTYYQAHHYFDTNGSSNYDEEYSAGQNKATQGGFQSFTDTISGTTPPVEPPVEPPKPPDQPPVVPPVDPPTPPGTYVPKAGDNVKVIQSSWNPSTVGQSGKVAQVDTSDDTCSVALSSGQTLWYPWSDLAAASTAPDTTKLKVGDVVKVTGGTYKGLTGTITYLKLGSTRAMIKFKVNVRSVPLRYLQKA